MIISSENSKIQIYRDNVIPGLKEIYCSYQSKLGGLIRDLAHIIELCNKFSIIKFEIDIEYDRVEVIQQVRRANFKPVTSISHFDLVTTLHSIINSIIGQVEFFHISGY